MLTKINIQIDLCRVDSIGIPKKKLSLYLQKQRLDDKANRENMLKADSRNYYSNGV
jgi:hypothetical protein